MADYNINAVTRRIVFSGSAGTGPYAFTFEVLDQTDLAVYFNAVKLTLTTDYTVSVAANGTGSVTIVTGTNVPSTPVTADQITIVGARDIERTTDFVTAGDLRAAALNEQLDGQIIMVQQISEESKRAMRAPVYDPALVEDGGVVDMELPTKASRAGNYLAFDTDGNPTVGVEIGVFRGNWAASTAYALRDIVKDTTNNNIYIATTAHTSSGSLPISSNADVAKWALIVDAAAAATSATNAANSAAAAATSETNAATSASNAATSETNAGTSETNAASSASAASTSATNASNSASAASTSASNASTSETNAASSASAASTSATNAASSASAASTSATNASNSASAASTSASNAATSETNAAASAASAEAAAASVYWNFDTSTTMADPGTGDVRFNNATIASVTQVAVSASSASTGNPDVSDFVAAWDDSTSTTKGYIVIREAGAPGTTIVFAISGTITDNTTWLQIPVTHVSSAGTLSASDDLYFSFSRTGDAGLGSGDLLAANNLSDVADAATARSNLSAAASGANTDITSLGSISTADLNGGTIDGAVIGGSSAAAGSFTTLSASSPISAADGSAAAPSITNTGDTNTGIFFPAADTVGVAVGGTEVWRYGSNPTTAKNLIINGAISVAQRGTSFTSYGATHNAYSLDQYKIAVAGSASARWTVTQESSGGVSGNAKWLKALVTTADTPGAAEGQAIIQRPEGQSIQALRRDGGGTKAATYSFDVIVHADGGSGLSFPVSLPVVFIIHDNVTDREIVSDVSVAAADTWERVTVSFPEDTSGGGPVNTSSAGSSVGITLAAGSNYVITADTWQNNTNVTLKTSSSDNFADATNNYVGFTEVQLEVGSVATDFEHEDYGTTLAKCLRYFERIKPTVADARFPGGALTSSSSAGQHVLPFLVQKRAVPTVTGTAAATFAWVEGDATEQALTGISYVVTDLTCTTVVCVLSSAATGGGHLKRDGSDTTHIDASAEL
jgi:hypothetical protein